MRRCAISTRRQKTNFVIDAIYDSTNTGQTKKVQYGV